jgi:four helix bundle protein
MVHINDSDWLKTVPKEITDDSLWCVTVYRYALFFSDIAWHDAAKLIRHRTTTSLSDQLYRAVGSMSANVEEGYSRGTGRDRARFYEYALGSARESRGWYYKAQHVLGEAVTVHRLRLLSEIIRLLLTMVPDQRGASLREKEVPYRAGRRPEHEAEHLMNPDVLLCRVPFPQDQTGV